MLDTHQTPAPTSTPHPSHVTPTPTPYYTPHTRLQSNMGAKNHAVIMPDADVDTVASALAGAAFGAAGQRCMAISAAVFVGGMERYRDALVQKARSLKVGGAGLPAGEVGVQPAGQALWHTPSHPEAPAPCSPTVVVCQSPSERLGRTGLVLLAVTGETHCEPMRCWQRGSSVASPHARPAHAQVNAGHEPGADLGPVISPEAKQRIERLIASGIQEVCLKHGGRAPVWHRACAPLLRFIARRLRPTAAASCRLLHLSPVGCSCQRPGDLKPWAQPALLGLLWHHERPRRLPSHHERPILPAPVPPPCVRRARGATWMGGASRYRATRTATLWGPPSSATSPPPWSATGRRSSAPCWSAWRRVGTRAAPGAAPATRLAAPGRRQTSARGPRLSRLPALQCRPPPALLSSLPSTKLPCPFASRQAGSLEEAIATVNANEHGNGTAIFTASGAAARRFQSEVDVGMVRGCRAAARRRPEGRCTPHALVASRPGRQGGGRCHPSLVRG